MNSNLYNSYLVLRNYFKSIRFIFWVHARIRCFLDNLKFFIIKFYFYFRRPPKNLFYKKIKYRRSFIKILRESSKRSPHVFWLGNDYDQDFSGFIQALNKIANVSHYSSGQSYGQDWNQHYLDIRIKKKQSNAIKKSVLKAHKDNKIDFLLMQTWGFKVCKKTLQEIKKETGCLIINIGMDDKHSFIGKLYHFNNGTYGLKNAVDYHLSASIDAVDWFRKSGILSDYFPEASCQEIFYPIENHIKKYQVGIVGGAYGIRKKIHDQLVAHDVQVIAYGHGWPLGRLENEKVNEFYNSCEIVLGVGGIGHCLRFCSLKLRDYDVPMSGSFYLTSFCKDLESEYVFGKEIIGYQNLKDLVKKTKLYLKNDKERKLIARRGYERAKNSHNYNKRINSAAFKMIGIKR